jgi:hypothetical protein
MRGECEAGCIIAAEYKVAVIVSFIWNLSEDANLMKTRTECS